MGPADGLILSHMAFRFSIFGGKSTLYTAYIEHSCFGGDMRLLGCTRMSADFSNMETLLPTKEIRSMIHVPALRAVRFTFS